jgi:lipopolysaccharide/colanic/teichoic acid biosynthesis glycosyltransferase
MEINSTRNNAIKILLSIFGVVAIIVALYLSYGIYFSQWNDPFTHSSLKVYFLILATLYIFFNCLTGINKSFVSRGFYKEFVVCINEVLILVSLLILVLFWMHRLFDSHRLVIGFFAVFFLFIDWSLRVLIKNFLIKVYLKSKFAKRLLIVTDDKCANNVCCNLFEDLDWTRQICGVSVIVQKDIDNSTLDDSLDKDTFVTSKEDNSILSEIKVNEESSISVVSGLDDLLDYVTKNNVDEVFVHTEAIYSNDMLKDTLSKIEEMGVRVNVRINIDVFNYLPNSYIKIDKLGKYQCVSVSRNFYSYKKIVAKHILDYIGGIVGFLIFGLIYCILGPIIKLDSKGPILYSQPRVGKNGRIFKCYKFRSMVTNADELKQKLASKNEMQGLMFKMENDPRITKVGKFIRKTSLDELPQFINVLKGDMSLVGTRPPTVDEYEKYTSNQKARVSMTTGLTGLWQISGRSDIKSFDDVIKLDMEYIDNWSIWLDIKIILMTIFVVLKGSGAK